MIELLAILTPIALINSVWILPYGIIGIVASLATPRPTLTASAFIAGIFLPHFLFGLLLAIGVDTAVFFGILGLGVILVADAVGWFFEVPLLPRYLL